MVRLISIMLLVFCVSACTSRKERCQKLHEKITSCAKELGKDGPTAKKWLSLDREQFVEKCADDPKVGGGTAIRCADETNCSKFFVCVLGSNPFAGIANSNFPEEETSYILKDKKELSYGNVKRFNFRIVVLEGRTKAQVTATLERAAIELDNEYKANAISIWAYRPQDNLDGHFSVGMVTYAPNGNWGEADSSAEKKTSVELNEMYFKPKVLLEKGTKVKLIDKDKNKIAVSKKPNSWLDEDVLVRVKSGTNAEITEVKSTPMPNHEFVRYQVKFQVAKKSFEGWVHEGEVVKE